MATVSYISFFCVIALISAFPDRVIVPANNGPPSVLVVKQPGPIQPGRQLIQQKPVIIQKPGRQIIQQGPIRPIASQPQRPLIVNPQPGQKVLVIQKQPQVVVVPSRKF